jgi:tRNA G18 (ribose-2'-O)-methylase SpoU
VIQEIDDVDDPRLADYRQLKDAVARRTIEGETLFVAEGPVAIERMLASGHTIRSVLVIESKVDRMVELLSTADVPIFVVTVERLRQITGFDLHRGAIAAGTRRQLSTLGEIATSTTRIAVLEGLNDPENLGAIARSARAFGIEALVLDPTCIDPYTRRTVRVSMGEVLCLRWCRVGAAEWPAAAFAELHRAGFETWAMTPAPDSVDIWALDPPPRIGIVLGAEGAGLSHAALHAASRRVRIAIDPDVDSLNVAAAAAVSFAIITHQLSRVE